MALHSRIESAIRTAKQWESDKALLREIRTSIPFEDLVPEQCLPISERCANFLQTSTADASDDRLRLRESLKREDDASYMGDDLLLKRLTLYFKREVMKWVNSPPCSNPNCNGNEDGKQMQSMGIRGPESEDEKNGMASRVEMYTCQLCNTPTTFPRYNSPRSLFTSRAGRCGEFANLFGAYCRAVGFDTRYCLDLTDHVWVEVWSVRMGKWVHADSCEGLIDRPNMYEQGWGKKLSYVIGATHDSVTDITKRYTRKFHTDDFQTRRREHCPDENTSNRAFMQMNATIRQMTNIPKGRIDELDKRQKTEEAFFGLVQSSGVWDVDFKEGRISGSYAWKLARGELGEGKKCGDDADDKEEEKEASFVVESFYPAPQRQDQLTICVQHPSKCSHECIVVNGVSCAATLSDGTSVVVIDELSGCILQSKAFSSWASVGAFVDTVPDGRIIAFASSVCSAAIDEATTKHLQRIGGLIGDTKPSTDPLMFVGQVGYNPKWTACVNTTDATVRVNVTIQLDIPSSLELKLRSEHNITPAAVTTRLPESIMPLKTQMEASSYQKRVAFEAYLKQHPELNSTVVGYATRPEAPVYLIGNESFPMRSAGGHTHDNGSNWTTYHYLPDALVSDDDVVTNDSEKTASKVNNAALFDVPVADDYFMGLLGGEILAKTGTSPAAITNTVNAIENTRLIALYFSAHWCGPCRGFTPMLIEFYNYLKEEVAPTHGLEVIFVSSDRSEAEFQQYYSSMPFKAVPFANRGLAQQLKSVFGVQGIPSLVILDTLSGRIVVSPEESRREVHQACRMGEQAIEALFNSWLDKVPAESKAMLDILALSCEESAAADSSSKETDVATLNQKASEYLVRKKMPIDSEDSAAAVKRIFAELVGTGMSPNEAAVEAIKRSTNQSFNLTEGAIKGACCDDKSNVMTVSIKGTVNALLQHNNSDNAKVANVITVAKKYVMNVQKDPSNPRFRTFRLSNKVFDQITSVFGSIQLLTYIGFTVFPSDIDFIASIPLSVDLNALSDTLDKIVEVYSA